eukprot:TRINITY_DN13264_c0_g1_i2.p1 TRINITY_DN13264_c0_g1~~TRINITY_DN13264_c0_g1_i2.p1  ORF type:complete len:994 (+),score=230.43 TRINITY_DN13264_c0_g1_i2:82-2982(+)
MGCAFSAGPDDPVLSLMQRDFGVSLSACERSRSVWSTTAPRVPSLCIHTDPGFGCELRDAARLTRHCHFSASEIRRLWQLWVEAAIDPIAQGDECTNSQELLWRFFTLVHAVGMQGLPVDLNVAGFICSRLQEDDSLSFGVAVHLLSTFTRASAEEQLLCMFSLVDEECTGWLTADEVAMLVDICHLKLREPNDTPGREGVRSRRVQEQLIAVLDQRGDSRVHFSDFVNNLDFVAKQLRVVDHSHNQPKAPVLSRGYFTPAAPPPPTAAEAAAASPRGRGWFAGSPRGERSPRCRGKSALGEQGSPAIVPLPPAAPPPGDASAAALGQQGLGEYGPVPTVGDLLPPAPLPVPLHLEGGPDPDAVVAKSRRRSSQTPLSARSSGVLPSSPISVRSPCSVRTVRSAETPPLEPGAANSRSTAAHAEVSPEGATGAAVSPVTVPAISLRVVAGVNSAPSCSTEGTAAPPAEPAVAGAQSQGNLQGVSLCVFNEAMRHRRQRSVQIEGRGAEGTSQCARPVLDLLMTAVPPGSGESCGTGAEPAAPGNLQPTFEIDAVQTLRPSCGTTPRLRRKSTRRGSAMSTRGRRRPGPEGLDALSLSSLAPVVLDPMVSSGLECGPEEPHAASRRLSRPTPCTTPHASGRAPAAAPAPLFVPPPPTVSCTSEGSTGASPPGLLGGTALLDWSPVPSELQQPRHNCPGLGLVPSWLLEGGRAEEDALASSLFCGSERETSAHSVAAPSSQASPLPGAGFCLDNIVGASLPRPSAAPAARRRSSRRGTVVRGSTMRERAGLRGSIAPHRQSVLLHSSRRSSGAPRRRVLRRVQDAVRRTDTVRQLVAKQHAAPRPGCVSLMAESGHAADLLELEELAGSSSTLCTPAALSGSDRLDGTQLSLASSLLAERRGAPARAPVPLVASSPLFGSLVASTLGSSGRTTARGGRPQGSVRRPRSRISNSPEAAEAPPIPGCAEG